MITKPTQIKECTKSEERLIGRKELGDNTQKTRGSRETILRIKPQGPLAKKLGWGIFKAKSWGQRILPWSSVSGLKFARCGPAQGRQTCATSRNFSWG